MKSDNKIKNIDKIKQNTIDFCNDCLGNKLITNNQPIDFLWEDFSENTALLAKMLIPHQDNYGKYKRETIQKIAYETALSETKNLMKDIEEIGPLPFRVWEGRNEKLQNILFTCTHMFLMSWPFYYFKNTGDNVSDDPKHKSNDIQFIKNEAMKLSKELGDLHFSKMPQIKDEIFNYVQSFYDNYENKISSYMIVIR